MAEARLTPIPGGASGRAHPEIYGAYNPRPRLGSTVSQVPALPSLPSASSGPVASSPAPAPTPVPASAPASLPVLSNTAAPDPYLEEQVRNLRARMGADTTERAIGRSTTGILDAAALGAADQGAANLASRGLVGSGAGQAFLHKQFFEPAQRAAAGAAADIARQREQDLDRLVLGGTAIMGAPGQSSLANRQLGLQQWQAQTGAGQNASDLALRQWQAQTGATQASRNLDLQQQQLNQQQQQSQIENWLRMYGMTQQGGY